MKGFQEWSSTNHLPDLPPESRIAILEVTHEAFEVLLRPRGWRRIQIGMLVVLCILLVSYVTATLLIWLNWGWKTTGGLQGAIQALPESPGFSGSMLMGCYFLGWFGCMAWSSKRVADEWTRIRIEAGVASICRPGFFWGERATEFKLECAGKHPRERYSVIHRLKLTGGETQFTCYTPLDYPDVQWLIDAINSRLPAPENEHAGG